MNASGLAHTLALSPIPARARHELYSLLRTTAWPGDVDAIVLAVHEALMNSQRHAGGATSAVVRTDGATLEVEIHDQGPGFDLESHARTPPDPLAERGRGLWLISQIADGWRVDRGQGDTCLRLLFHP